jgi:ABC-type thiamin/hydroxymethylpyrimidine transport system permease subunit
MTLDYTNLNWVAIVVAAVVTIVFGFIYYLPQVLGRRWAAAAGIDLAAMSQVSPLAYATWIVQALVVAYVLDVLMKALGVSAIGDGLILAFIIWLGFMAVTALDSVIYERRSWEYWLLGQAFRLISLMLMGGVIAYLGA